MILWSSTVPGRKFTMKQRGKHKRKKYVILSGILIVVVFLFGCQNQNIHTSAKVETSEKLTSGIDGILSEIEIIDVKYKEVWNFESYSKTYYIEPENWGTYGLEDSTKVASTTGLDYMTFEDDEQVVFCRHLIIRFVIMWKNLFIP